MSKFNNISKSMLSNPLIQVIIVIIILIIVLALIRIVYPEFTTGIGFNAHVGTLKGSIQLEAFENNNGPMFVMYYADWCGHCKTTKPHFKELMNESPENIKVMMVNVEDKENKELVESQDIKGFPTIRFYKNGLNNDYDEYEGERTIDGFKTFLGKMMNN